MNYLKRFTAQVILIREKDELFEAFYLKQFVRRKDRQGSFVIKGRRDRGRMRERENIDGHMTLQLK